MAVDLKVLQDKLKVLGDPWTADRTCLSKLDEEQLERRFGGAALPPSLPESSELVGSVEPVGLPTSFDWRDAEANGVKGNWMTPVKNQGNCSSCVAFGTISALEALLKINYYKRPDVYIDLSEAYLWGCGIGGNCDKTWTPNGSCDYLKANGVPDEACYPYPGGVKPTSKLVCPSECDDDHSAPQTRMDHTRINGWSLKIGEVAIKTSLVTNGPLIVIFYAGEDIKYYVSGVYKNGTCLAPP